MRACRDDGNGAGEELSIKGSGDREGESSSSSSSCGRTFLHNAGSATKPLVESPRSIWNGSEEMPMNHTIRPTIVLRILVVIDMFSVSLVVPLLHQYYRNAGIESAQQRELLSSLFSSSQIVGGLLLGALSDVGILSRRKILFLSFAGSSISYALIIKGGIRALICSRVLVGLVKQTMTVTTSLLARYTTKEERAVQMGLLGASSTVAWVVGPTCGALLYKHVDTSAPPVVASFLFVVNSAIAAMLLPNKEDGTKTDEVEAVSATKSSSKFSSFFQNLRACFSSTALASVVVSRLLFGWVVKTTSYANMASFYEEKYGIEPHQRGFLSSYQQSISFFVQSFLVKYLLTSAGGERRAACISASVLGGVALMEVWSSFHVFVGIISPIVAIASGCLSLSLGSLVTQVAPKQSLGSVLAALDVLQNAANVTVPLYRTILFGFVARIEDNDEDSVMKGDPDPQLWLLISFAHWAFFATSLTYLLLRKRGHDSKDSIEEKQKNI